MSLDVIALQDAKKALKRVGELNKLKTTTKDNAVAAINEIQSEIRQNYAVYSYESTLLVSGNSTGSMYMPFMNMVL
jgi:hypothetical protein